MKNTVRLPADIGSTLAASGLRVRDLVVYTNSGCNLRCRHCYLGNALLSRAIEFDAESVGCAVRGFGRLDRLTLLGGEVFAHSEAASLFRVIDRNSIGEPRLTTNLTIWHEEAIEVAVSHGFRFCVSIDGATATSHDKMRGSGSFLRTIVHLKKLVKTGASIEITHTICRANIDEFQQLLNLCRSIGVRLLNLHLVTPQGNAATAANLTLRPSEWRAFVDRELRDCGSSDQSVSVRYPLRYVTTAELERLRASGYHHHAEGSFHCDGSRVVIYPTGELFVSSEAFGSDASIGFVRDGRTYLRTDSKSELGRARSLENFDISHLNPALAGDAAYPVALSVSFKLITRL